MSETEHELKEKIKKELSNEDFLNGMSFALEAVKDKILKLENSLRQARKRK